MTLTPCAILTVGPRISNGELEGRLKAHSKAQRAVENGEVVDVADIVYAQRRQVFGDTELTYTKPTTRLQGHLAGYDPAQSPEFKWPPRLEEARRKIREQVKARGSKGKQPYTK